MNELCLTEQHKKQLFNTLIFIFCSLLKTTKQYHFLHINKRPST